MHNLQRDNFALNLQPNQVKLALTKGQLAALLATTIPETISRVFAKLSQAGLIEIDGAVITLVNFPELKRLSGDYEAD